MMLKRCKICGKVFSADKRERIFCSRGCSHLDKRGNPRLTGRPRGRRIKVECRVCGKTIDATPGRIPKYCGRECYDAARLGRPRGAYKPPEERLCIVCGKEFLVGGRGFPPKSQKSCSGECQRASRYRHGARCKPLTECEAAYMAGIFDGEGSIVLHARNWAHCKSIGLKAMVSNTYVPLLNWMRERTKVGYVHVHQRGEGNGWKDMGVWQINAEAAESFLRQLLPFLIVKRAQAELALSFQERIRVPALKAQREWQAEYLERMRELNRRGRKGE